jgi:hypothetical protein
MCLFRLFSKVSSRLNAFCAYGELRVGPPPVHHLLLTVFAVVCVYVHFAVSASLCRVLSEPRLMERAELVCNCAQAVTENVGFLTLYRPLLSLISY